MCDLSLLNDKQRKVWELKQSGLSSREIASIVGLCRGQVNNLLRSANLVLGLPVKKQYDIKYKYYLSDLLNADHSKLGRGELDVLMKFASGMSYEEIAQSRSVSRQTIYCMMNNIWRKLMCDDSANKAHQAKVKKYNQKYCKDIYTVEHGIRKYGNAFVVTLGINGRMAYVARTSSLEEAREIRDLVLDKRGTAGFDEWFAKWKLEHRKYN